MLYKPPLPKRTGDLQWRIAHGALATNRFLSRLDPGVGEGCPHCGETETIVHIFSDCDRITSVFGLLQRVSAKLRVPFTLEMFILGPIYCKKQRGKCVLLNFLFGQAKLAIWLTRRNLVRGSGPLDPLQMLKGMVSAHLRVEHTYFLLINDFDEFERVWCLGGAICTIGGDGLNVCL